MLRIAFVNLRARTKDWHHVIMVPMGVMVLSAVLKRRFGAKVDVRLFDVTTFPEQEEPDAAIRAWLEELRPDVVGIRGFSSQADEFPIIARIAKEVDPRCLVLAGGPHASTGSPTLYGIREIDHVVPHEGEEVLGDVVEALLEGRPLEGIPGLCHGGPDGPVIVPPRPALQDLDALPFPDYDVIDLDAYQGRVTMTSFLPRARTTSLFTSRGCYYRCSYCHTNFGKKVRYRGVQNVVDEIQHLVEVQGVGELQIIDDIFNADPARAIGIFDEVVRRGLQVHIAFPNGLRADRMDEEFVQAAKAAGTYYWALAVETASPRLQKQVYKFNKLDKVFETIELSDRYGIFTCTFNMLGFPTETEEEMRATIDFNLRSSAHATHFFVVTPYEGTTMHEELARWGIQADSLGDELLGFQNFSGSDRHGSLSPVPRSRIQELIVDAVRRFFFDRRRLRRMIELCHSRVHLAQHLETRRWSAGYDWGSIPDREAARRLGLLFEEARATDPVGCAHLPAPPAWLLGPRSPRAA